MECAIEGAGDGDVAVDTGKSVCVKADSGGRPSSSWWEATDGEGVDAEDADTSCARKSRSKGELGGEE